MNLSRAVYVYGGLILLGATACRSPVHSVPNETPDLTGQIVEVRWIRAMGGPSITSARTTGDRDVDLQRLKVRVIGSPTTAPGMVAYVGVDGITELVRRNAPVGSGGRPELEGAFVRIWFRGKSGYATPVGLSAMARMVAIDSLGGPAGEGQQ